MTKDGVVYVQETINRGSSRGKSGLVNWLHILVSADGLVQKSGGEIDNNGKDVVWV